MNELNKRKINIELLRIVCILMIIGLHYLNGEMGGALAKLTPSHLNFYLAYFFESYFIIGVNLFVLITGYFQSEKKGIKVGKIIGLLVITVFYSIILYFCAVYLKIESFNLNDLKAAVFPFFYDRYWFVKIYTILILLSPYLNILITNLSKKMFESLLVVMIVLFSIWPSFVLGSANLDAGYGIISFTTMYFIGAYLKKHYQPKKGFYFYFSGYLIFAFVTFIFSILSLKITSLPAWNYNFIFNLLSATCLFLAFTKIELSQKFRLINHFAGYVFGIYLIHANVSIRIFLYQKILHTGHYWFSPFFIIHFFISIIVIFSFCCLIEMLRILLFRFIHKTWCKFSKYGWSLIPFSSQR